MFSEESVITGKDPLHANPIVPSNIMASHRLLQAFETSKPAFGAWLTIPNTWVARTTAAASPNITWLVIDGEHGLIPLHPGASEIVSAIAGLGPNAPTVLVRIPATGPCADGSATWQIKYVLDAGARGIIVPMVCSRADCPYCIRKRFCRFLLQHKLAQSLRLLVFLPRGTADSETRSHIYHGAFLLSSISNRLMTTSLFSRKLRPVKRMRTLKNYVR